MDDFSDDGFEDIDTNVLQELENNAIQLTQAQAQAQPEPRSFSSVDPGPIPTQVGYEVGYEDDDLDDTIVVDQLARAPNISLAGGREKSVPAAPPLRPVPNLAAQRWNQSREPSIAMREVTPLPTQPYAIRPGSSSSRPLPPARPVPPQSQYRRPAPPVTQRYAAQTSEAPREPRADGQNDIIATLQSRLHLLETELTSAKGEIAIVRSKHDKAQANHDTEVARLKRQNAEQQSKQERAVEAALAAERSATTELQFARQDLKEELGRAKSRRKEALLTPRKNKSFAMGMGDGFDDIELITSPSKGRQDKGKSAGPIAFPISERTPTKGKRKRSVLDSPMHALETHSDDLEMQNAVKVEMKVEEEKKKEAKVPVRRTLTHVLPYDFMRLVLDHRSRREQPPTFDLFSRFHFPSDPSQSFSALIFHNLHTLGDREDPRRLLVDFCRLLIDIWTQCLQEKYYEPIYHLVSLVIFTFQLNTEDLAPKLVAYIVPVAQTTCLLLAVPRFKSQGGNLANNTDATVQQLNTHINILNTLSLLYLLALGCASAPPRDVAEGEPPQPSPQLEFWKLMPVDLVLVMLSPKQQPLDFHGMLSLLTTSVRSDSIGPIPDVNDAATSQKEYARTTDAVARAVIERVSVHLVDTPRWAGRGTAKSAEVHLAVLRTLLAFIGSAYGARQIAIHPTAISRLVTVLSATVDLLYDMDIPRNHTAMSAYEDEAPEKQEDAMDIEPQEGQAEESVTVVGESAPKDPVAAVKAKGQEEILMSSDNSEPAFSFLSATADPNLPMMRAPPVILHLIIASAMRLLHFLITSPQTASLANINAKLATTAGGAQRYLLTLARLNFAEEDLVYEAGVEAEIAEMAHELLEMAVTPDEGEGVGEVFGL